MTYLTKAIHILLVSGLMIAVLGGSVLAGTPAGVEVINQASATFTYDGFEYAVDSNPVYTTILPVYGISIIPNGTIEEPGQYRQNINGADIYFSYTLYNTGNITDSYTLRARNIDGDPGFYVAPEEIHIYLDVNGDGMVNPGEVEIDVVENLAADNFVQLVVTFTIPIDAPANSVGYFNIIGRGIEGNVVDQDNVAIAEVAEDVNLMVNKAVDRRTAVPGDTLSYVVRFQNSGVAAIHDIMVSDPINWDENMLHVTLLSGSVEAVPHGTISYQVENDEWVTEEPEDLTTIRRIRAHIPSLVPTQIGYLRFQVQVNDDAPPGRIENVALYTYAEESERPTNQVITTVVREVEIHIGPQDNAEALPGGEGSDDDISTLPEAIEGVLASFTNTLKNTGNATDIFNVVVDRERSNLPPTTGVLFYHGDGVTPLLDSNRDHHADVMLRPNEVRSIVVKVIYPKHSEIDPNESQDLVLRAESATRSIYDPYVHPNYTTDRIVHVRPAEEYWAPLRMDVLPDRLLRWGEEVFYTLTFANLSENDIDYALLTDDIDYRLKTVHEWTDGFIYMYPLPDSIDFGDGLEFIEQLGASSDEKGAPAELRQDSTIVYLTGEYDDIIIENEQKVGGHQIKWAMRDIPARSWGQVTFKANIREGTPDEDIIPNMATLQSKQTVVVVSNIVFVQVLNPMVIVEKETLRPKVEVGDVVEYEIKVSNISPNATLINNELFDFMPLPFRYLEGTTTFNGQKFPDPKANGNELVWSFPDSFYAGDTHTFRYRTVAGANAYPGKTYINTTYARGVTSILNIVRVSEFDDAEVQIIEGMFRPEGRILGRVFIDENDNRLYDDGETGIQNVRLYLEDGRYVITDPNGLYFFTDIDPGTHVVKMDRVTIPPDLIAKTIDNRFAGDPFSQFVTFLPSGIAKANFRLIRPALYKFDLNKSLWSEEVNIFPSETQKTIRVFDVPSSYYDAGKADLKMIPEQFHEAAAFLKEHPDWTILIEGHTDIRPIHTVEFPSNQELSEARAQSVADALRDLGASEKQMIIKGYGPTIPRVPNTSLKNMALNRRVEVTLMPPEAEETTARVQYIFRMYRGDGAMYDVELVNEALPGEIINESIRLNESPVSPPENENTDSLFVWTLGDFPDGIQAVFTYTVEMNTTDLPQVLGRLAYVRWTDAEGQSHQSDPFALKLKPEFQPKTNEVVFTLGDFLFDTGKADLRPGSYHYLERLVDILMELYPAATGRVEGHTDIRPINTPEFPSNWELSEARAGAVYDYLVEHGVDDTRMKKGWFAATRPVAPNTSLENMQKNRRVEVIIQLPAEEGTVASHQQQTQITIKIETEGGVFDSLTVTDQLIDGAGYIDGSATFNNQPLPDPIIEGNELIWQLLDVPEGVSYLKYEVVLSREVTEWDELNEFNTQYDDDELEVGVYKGQVSSKEAHSTQNENERGLSGRVSGDSSDSLDTSRGTIPVDPNFVASPPKHTEKPTQPIRKAFVVSPMMGTIYTTRNQITITIQIPLAAQPELRVNGEAVTNDKIGTKRLDPSLSLGQYDYVSVPIRKGENQLVAVGKMPNGTEIVSKETIVHFADRPTKMKLRTDPKYPTADGITTPTVILEVYDENDLPVADGIFVTIEIDRGHLLGRDAHPQMEGFQVRTKDGAARVQISPAYQPEDRFLTATIATLRFSKTIEFVPELREFMMVVLGEGTIGYESFHGDLSKVPPGEDFDDEFYTEGGVKVFLKGRILGKYLLTAHYDSRKTPEDDELFEHQVDPDDYYPVYGDESIRGSDAESNSPLYVKVERDKSYAMFGDYQTELDQTELASYQRTYQGAKLHVENDYTHLTAFASHTNQSFQLEEFQGQGISGYYFLSHSPIIRNTEYIELEIRDRFHSENILSSISLSRHQDYDIDYDDGSIMFKEPISAIDDDLNPIFVVVRYESESQNDDYWKYGGRLALKYGKWIEVGGTAVVEENGIKDYQLLGADARLNLLGEAVSVSGEYAQTEDHEHELADAYKAAIDVNHNGSMAKVYYRRVDEEFYNPSMSGAEVGTEKYGVTTQLRRGDHKDGGAMSVGGEAYQQNRLDQDLELRVAKGTVGYGTELVETEVGYQYSESNGVGGNDKQSHMATGQVKVTPSENFNATVGHEQIIQGDVVDQFPSKSRLEMEYKRSFKHVDQLRVFTNTEYAYDDIDSTENRLNSKVGVDLQILENTTISTSTTFGNEGTQVSESVGQKFHPNKKWSMELRGEAAQTLADGGAEEYQAVSAGVSYSPEPKQRNSARYEIRFGEETTKHVINVQLLHRLGENVHLAVKESYWYNDTDNGTDEIKSDGTIGVAYRPLNHDKLNILSMLRVRYDRTDMFTQIRSIISVEGIYQSSPNLQLRGRYGLKRSDWSSVGEHSITYTDLVLAELTYDLLERVEIGSGGRVLHQYETNTYRYSLGVHLGIRLIQNLYGVIGYNIVGFEDGDFSDYSYWQQGPYLSLRIKLDEGIFENETQKEE